MEPFTKLTGSVLPMDRMNVDTDSIMPARFLKRIERTGWGEFLFYDWRFLAEGRPTPKFILNASGYQSASVMVVGRNFGSGSSREHAVWALVQYGIRAIVAYSLADIFHKNCLENGLIPVLLPENLVDGVMTRAQTSPGYRLTVDLERSEVWDGEGFRSSFVVHADPETHEFRRYCLLNGLDEIGLTLQHGERIAAYEEQRAVAN